MAVTKNLKCISELKNKNPPHILPVHAYISEKFCTSRYYRNDNVLERVCQDEPVVEVAARIAVQK